MYCEVAGGRIFYEVQGEGELLVLIHGGCLDRRMWDDQFAVFAQHFRTVRYDIRGHGRSDLPRQPYSDADDLKALITHLGERAAYLVGLSLGGRIAIDFALQVPEMVRALVLAGPGLSGFTLADPEVTGSLGEVARALRAGKTDEARALLLEVPFWRQDDPVVKHRLTEMLRDTNFDLWKAPVMSQEINPPAMGRLGEIKAPTLVVVGEGDVPDILRIAEILENGIPGATRVIIPGTGHMLNMQKPPEFNRIVLDFLTGLSQEATR